MTTEVKDLLVAERATDQDGLPVLLPPVHGAAGSSPRHSFHAVPQVPRVLLLGSVPCLAVVLTGTEFQRVRPAADPSRDPGSDSTEVADNVVSGNLICQANTPPAQLGDSGGDPNTGSCIRSAGSIRLHRRATGAVLQRLLARVLELRTHVGIDEVSVLDPLEPVSLQKLPVLCIQQSAGNSGRPELDLALALLRYRPLNRHVGELDATAGPKHTVDRRERRLLVRDEIDHTVRDDDVEAPVVEGQLFDLPLHESDVADAKRGRPPTRLLAHLGGHVDPRHRPRRADHQRRHERIRPSTRAEIEHVRARLDPPQRPRVRDPGERLHHEVGHPRQLLRVPEILCPGETGREDEILPRLLRDGSVRLLDLGLQKPDINPNVNGNRKTPQAVSGDAIKVAEETLVDAEGLSHQEWVYCDACLALPQAERRQSAVKAVTPLS